MSVARTARFRCQRRHRLLRIVNADFKKWLAEMYRRQATGQL